MTQVNTSGGGGGGGGDRWDSSSPVTAKFKSLCVLFPAPCWIVPHSCCFFFFFLMPLEWERGWRTRGLPAIQGCLQPLRRPPAVSEPAEANATNSLLKAIANESGQFALAVGKSLSRECCFVCSLFYTIIVIVPPAWCLIPAHSQQHLRFLAYSHTRCCSRT